MRFFLMLLTIIVSTAVPVASAWQCSALQERYGLSEEQVYKMWMSYEFAHSEGFGSTLAAIALKESSAGVALYNLNDPSAGHHHVLAVHAIRYLELEDNQVDYAMGLLADNFALSATIAMQEFMWWYNRHNGDMFKALRSYNQGYYWKVPQNKRIRSWNYAIYVSSVSKFIDKNCNWEEIVVAQL